MGEEMLLASQRAVPIRLKQRGFRFAFPELEPALRYELGACRPSGRSRCAGPGVRGLPARRTRRPAQYAMARAWAMLSRRPSSSSMNAATSARAIFLPPGRE